jgi:hypothetical protein
MAEPNKAESVLQQFEALMQSAAEVARTKRDGLASPDVLDHAIENLTANAKEAGRLDALNRAAEAVIALAAAERQEASHG